MKFADLDLELEKFVPLFPVLTGHTQTILGHIVPSKTVTSGLSETILHLEDGDELLLEYSKGHSDHTVSIYHGLAGDSQADYIRRSADIARSRGWNVVLVNHRGANSKAKAAKTYHSGRGEDASAVIAWARKQYPGSRQIALGFSMSGSILLNLVTGRYGAEQPDFAVVVNAPLNLKTAAEYLTLGLSKIYDYRFYLILKTLIQKKEKLKLPVLGRTLDIDELYTSKANGFVDAADYYEKCSAGKYLERIKTKTFVLSAHDDPFIDVKDYLKGKWSPNVHLTLQTFGGHMGYFSRKKNPRYGHRWLDHYLGSVFDKIEDI